MMVQGQSKWCSCSNQTRQDVIMMQTGGNLTGKRKKSWHRRADRAITVQVYHALSVSDLYQFIIMLSTNYLVISLQHCSYIPKAGKVSQGCTYYSTHSIFIHLTARINKKGVSTLPCYLCLPCNYRACRANMAR